MSMLSAQCDELRELATRCDELQVGAVKAVKMPSDMGSILRDAADTIWQLRDDLQRTNAENARLRSELESVGVAAYLYGRSDLNADNAKLRELVRAFDWCTENFDTPNKCDRCPLPQSDALEPECEVRMRELGVKVD